MLLVFHQLLYQEKSMVLSQHVNRYATVSSKTTMFINAIFREK